MSTKPIQAEIGQNKRSRSEEGSIPFRYLFFLFGWLNRVPFEMNKSSRTTWMKKYRERERETWQLSIFCIENSSIYSKWIVLMNLFLCVLVAYICDCATMTKDGFSSFVSNTEIYVTFRALSSPTFNTTTARERKKSQRSAQKSNNPRSKSSGHTIEALKGKNQRRRMNVIVLC